MSALRAPWLAWGAVVALLAYPAHAQVIGQESAILGGEDGFFRPTGGGESTVTIDAMPYTRTVTCDTITVTGTYTGTAPTGWSASPSGDTGSCTDLGGGTFSCVVDVDPDASGEGVETITIGNDTVDIGFYVAGSHSCFLAQSVDGSYNSTLADSDPVATWENLGSSALDVTQGTAANQPTFKTSIVGGNPVVRCDGGDSLVAASAANWIDFNDNTDMLVSAVVQTTLANPDSLQALLTTRNTSVTATAADIGFGLALDDQSSSSRNDRVDFGYSTGAAAKVVVGTNNNSAPAQKFNLISLAFTDDGGAGNDLFLFVNAATEGATTKPTAATNNPLNPLIICRQGAGTSFLTGDVFRILMYTSTITATQRGINQAVDEWALGGTLPVTP